MSKVTSYVAMNKDQEQGLSPEMEAAVKRFEAACETLRAHNMAPSEVYPHADFRDRVARIIVIADQLRLEDDIKANVQRAIP